MQTAKQTPQWWQLYLIVPLLIALFVIDGRLQISAGGHQAVQIGIVLVVYWVIHRWLKANEHALSSMDQLEATSTFRVIRFPIYSLPEQDNRPLIQLPDSELKGVLSDTFDIDSIDAKVLPVEEVSQK